MCRELGDHRHREIRLADTVLDRYVGNYRQGIMIGIGAQNNRIGGTATGEGNVIAYNGQGGIRIDAP